MARRGHRATVVLLAAPETLAGLDAACARAGIRLVRLISVRTRPVPTERWLPRLADRPAPDVVVVTSRAAVSAGVRRWLRGRRSALPSVDYWAAGPTTARALRAVRARPVHRARTLGAEGIAGALARLRPRRILYFRSDRAGPALARKLRRLGHRVDDTVVYRVVPRTRISPGEARAVLTSDVVAATSPSALSLLSGSTLARRIAARRPPTRLVVLGPTTRSAARALGFRNVSVAPSPNPERFTRHLLRELEHAAA